MKCTQVNKVESLPRVLSCLIIHSQLRVMTAYAQRMDAPRRNLQENDGLRCRRALR